MRHEQSQVDDCNERLHQYQFSKPPRAVFKYTMQTMPSSNAMNHPQKRVIVHEYCEPQSISIDSIKTGVNNM